MPLLDSLFRSPAIDRLFTDEARLQGMLDFEAALARAEAACGVIPPAAAAAIAAKCRAALFDFAALQKDAAQAGNLAIPMLRQLSALVESDDATAAGFVHWGATSQDAIDTGMMLQLRAALGETLAELRSLCVTLADLAEKHRATVMVGRTWMQHAAPTTFGMKAAGWLHALLLHLARLEKLSKDALALQFGGAVGTLATLRSDAGQVAQALGKELSLKVPEISWHGHRDRFAEFATTFGLLTGTLGKIARDISLHTQSEIAELAEPGGAGRGTSSSMPQKRNPVGCAVVLSAALRVPALVSTILAAMVQEDERGLGGWHAEWETLPELACLAGGALYHLSAVISGLEVDAVRMSENLAATRGLIYAEAVTDGLARGAGKKEARRLVEAACRQSIARKTHLRDELLASRDIVKHLPAAEIDALFDPQRHLGHGGQMIDDVLKSARLATRQRDGKSA